MNISFEQARRILEPAFYPLVCECQLLADGNAMSLRLYDRQTRYSHLLLPRLEVERYESVRGLANLVAQIEHELALADLHRRMQREAG